MHIGSGLNTVSSMYRQQKGNNMKAPASAEKTFYTAETPKVYQIFTTDNMLWTGGNGTGLSYCLKYADDSTDENPVVLAKGVDENGKEFEQRIYINDVNPSIGVQFIANTKNNRTVKSLCGSKRSKDTEL